MTLSFIFITDIIGTVAFTVSAAMEGIRKNMDIFGINIFSLAYVILAFITSVSYIIFNEETTLIIGFIAVILIRCIAAHYKLNLPRIKHK